MSAKIEGVLGQGTRRLHERPMSVAAWMTALVVGLMGLIAATVVASDENRQPPPANDEVNKDEGPADSHAEQLAKVKAELLEANQELRAAQV